MKQKNEVQIRINGIPLAKPCGHILELDKENQEEFCIKCGYVFRKFRKIIINDLIILLERQEDNVQI